MLVVVFEIKTQADVASETSQKIQEQLSIRYHLLQKSIQDKRRQIQFLHSTPPIQGIVRASKTGIDPYDGTPLNQWKSRLQIIFEGFLENNPQLAQIRYIGIANNGRELVRVDRINGNIRVIKEQFLQSKGQKDYVKKAAERIPGEIYVSNITLNQEHGKIEFPYWPTYRVATPVYDEQQNIFGVLVINVFAENIQQTLQQNLTEGFQFFLLNPNGEFVVHPDDSYLFGHELGTGHNWSNDYLSASERRKRPQQFSPHPLLNTIHRATQETLVYQAKDLLISSLEEGRYLRLIVAVPNSYLEGITAYRRSTILIIISVILVLIVALISFYQNYINKKIDLSEARSEYEAIINGSTDAILAMDQEGIITRWNRSAESIFGYTEQYIVGKSFFKLLDPEPSLIIKPTTIEDVYQGDIKDPFQVKAITRSGAKIDISVTLSSIYSNDQGVLGVAAIIRDITSQIIIEEQIKDMNASLEKQVQERTKELEQARNEALSASKAKSEFVANVSHEIRTPMNGVLGMLNLLKKAQISPQQKEYLLMAERSALTLTALINDILDVSKMEAGKLELQESEFNLARLISDVFSSMFIGMQHKPLESILNIAKLPLVNVIGDANRIRQILTNLIANSIKFTEQGEIELKAEGKVIDHGRVKIVCSVRDTGIGISAEKKDQLFEAFSQEDSSITKRYGGTGLGLAITRQLCQLMNGSISVSNNIDRGSTFTFDICLKSSEDCQSLKDLYNLEGASVLVIDSSHAQYQANADLIELWDGKTALCESQASALQLLQTPSLKPFNIIIINEPESNPTSISISLLEYIATYRKASHCKVIRLTKQSTLLIPWLNGRLCEVTVKKPVTPYEMIAALKKELYESFEAPGIEQADTLPTHNASLANFKGEKILVVDDNEINHEVTAGLLEDFHFQLFRANNGQQAIDLLLATPQDQPISLILMDCQMPVMDGYTASEKIRRGEAGNAHQHTPIIAMTANAMSGDRDRCLSAGMSDYLSKPLQPSELEEKLAHWFQQKPSIKQENQQDQLPTWDKGALLTRVKGREDRLQILVDLYVASAQENSDKLSAAVEAMNFERINSVAHSIKGSAANLSALNLQHVCQHLESAAKSLNSKEVLFWWQQFQPSQQELLSVLVNPGHHKNSA